MKTNSTNSSNSRRDGARSRVASTFRLQPSISHRAMLIDGSDERFRRMLFLTRLFADRLATFREAVAHTIGLTGNQYVILLATAHAQRAGGVTVRDVARYALMASTHVTTQAGALVRKGFLRKAPNGHDRRSVLLQLTPKGEQAMNSIAELRREFNDAFFLDVSRTAMQNAASLLEQVVANTDRALPLLERARVRPSASRRPK